MNNSIIDNRYERIREISTEGGMGSIYLVQDISQPNSLPSAMKVCLMDDEDGQSRFRREVRIMEEFRNNPKVASILHSNLNHDRPYFVMKYYSLGDLTTIIDSLVNDLEQQESLFLEMIDCLDELHSRGHFHRDIKPQNFLRDETNIIIADLGLIRDIHSHTSFTQVSVRIGTEGYMPPEFRLTGGFMNPTAASDIFMLGRTIYYLLSRRDPLYPDSQNIPPPIWRVLEKSWRVRTEERYQTLNEIKAALIAAYDVLLHRIDDLFGKTQQLLAKLQVQNHQSEEQEHPAFLRLLHGLLSSEQKEICGEMGEHFFKNFEQEYEPDRFLELLGIYKNMVEAKGYDYAFAGNISRNMRVIFESSRCSNNEKEMALRIAIWAAYECNRFSAMDTCIEIVKRITDPDLALRIAEILPDERSGFFLSRSTPNDFNNQIIRSKLRLLSESQTN
jgi:eukaryotic-like serine/threonine-protein kinase